MPFSTGKDGRPELRLYVCGVTPYDTGHMGHAFTFCAFDVLVRWVEAAGIRVRYVQNVTDVDDPLFDRARRDGVDWRELAAGELARHIRDMDLLGWRRPDFMPRVSNEIEGIVAAVERLGDLGLAYQTDAVYFPVDRFRGYGEVSHRSRLSMLRKLRDEGSLGTVGVDAKRDPLDFALWRRSGPGEPEWPSHFGPGRPGWHIECSAMAMRYLGDQIDVHGGGRDLRFSHHESERAQSESLTGKAPFARAWMHTGMVRYEGRKMSKSLGNLVVVEEALERAPAGAVRLYLAMHRYRGDWEFQWAGLDAAANLCLDLARLLAADRAEVDTSVRPTGAAAPGVAQFAAAMDDDLDTPRAVRALRAAVHGRDALGAQWMAAVLCGEARLR